VPAAAACREAILVADDSSETYTILVVDDDRDVLDLAREHLQRHGHHVLTAHSAEEALNVFLATPVHLLVVDYVMPGMDGAQLVRAIRGFDPFIQIVIQTAHAADRPSQQVLDELDIQGYHDKTDGPQKLMAWVTVCLRAYRLIRELRERERVHRELLSNLSHEFRTPLNVVHGYASLLLEQAFGTLPAAAHTPVRAIEQNTRELSDIVDNVLEHTRMEAGTAELSLGGVDVGPLLRELERLGATLLQQKPVTLSVEIDPTLPIIESDAQKLRTILRNLFSNAVKFTQKGAIEVRATHRAAELVITVRDTGIGMTRPQLEALFQPFRQGDGSSTRRHGGLGLGLALSRRYARLLGGDLTVESALDKGTTFTLTIPGISGVTSLAVDAPAAGAPSHGHRTASPARPAIPEPASLSAWLTDVATGWRPLFEIPSAPAALDWALDVLDRLNPTRAS
jgi:signal transduction histidine kinase